MRLGMKGVWAVPVIFSILILGTLGLSHNVIFAATTNLDSGGGFDNGNFFNVFVFTVSGESTIQDMAVRLSVEHPNIDQLRIEIESPQGTIVRLHEGATTGISNIEDVLYLDVPSNCLFPNTCAGVDGPGALADFIGEDPNGTWTLFVADLFSLPGPPSITGTVYAGGESAEWGTAIGTQILLNDNPSRPQAHRKTPKITI